MTSHDCTSQTCDALPNPSIGADGQTIMLDGVRNIGHFTPDGGVMLNRQ